VFTAGVALTACLVFGLAPAISATRASLGTTLKAAGRGSTGSREGFGVRRALVVFQIALSLVLVVGALLFVRSLRNLTTMDPGFRQEGVLTLALDYRKANVPEANRGELTRRIVERLRTIPGVLGVSQVFKTPVDGNFWNERVVVGGVTHPGQINFNAVGPDYFAIFSIPLIAGRDFDVHDTPQSVRVAIVSESFARTVFPGRNAIGQSFDAETGSGEPHRTFQIVGIAKDTKYASLRDPFEPLVHVAATQEPDQRPSVRMALLTSADTASTTVAITAALAEINPAIAIQYHSVREQLAQSLTRERLMATLSGFFGGLAVLIATIGLYGVMSYMVARRRIEIGVRLALGADAGAVLRMIVREAGVLLAAGLVIGGVLSVLAARTADTFLYGLTPGDPITLALAMASLASVTLLASWIPARRASRLSPTVALRDE
jgi:predicted permease